MNYKNFTTDWNKPAIFTAQTYGTKTTVEIDHSDLDLDEVMDAFQTLINGMGYHSDAFKQWVLERAAEYQEEEDEKWDEEKVQFHNGVKETIKSKLNQKPVWNWDNDVDYNENPWGNEEEDTEEERNKRMDVIGQNGNEGTHYFKDSDRFENYQNKYETKCYCGHTDYCDCIPEEDNTEWSKPNDVLIDAKKQYDEQMKMDAKKKPVTKRKGKTVQEWEEEIDLGGHE